MSSILVLGKRGQLALSLNEIRPEYLYVGRDELDLSRPQDIWPFLDKTQPSIIINTSAYTAVDKAESERDLAFAINAEAPKKLAQWSALNDALLIHFSTDYVFDGSLQRPYKENDSVAPLNVYGESKLAGEEAIQMTSGPHYIFRTSWIFSHFGQNFLKTMLRLASEREVISVVGDQVGRPTQALELARKIVQLVDEEKEVKIKRNGRERGLYHLAGPEVMSWFDFAQRIFAQARAVGWDLKLKECKQIKTEEYPTPAERPLYSVLDCAKAQSHLHLSLENLDASILDSVRRWHASSRI